MMTKRKRRILFWLCTIFFIVILVPVFLFSFGYGIGTDFKIKKTGSIAINANISGAEVSGTIVRKRKTSILTKSAIIKNIVPGEYKINVEKDGFWKWEKNISVFSEKVSVRNILLVPKEINGTLLDTTTIEKKSQFILKNNSVYDSGQIIFASVKNFWELPQSKKLLILGRDNTFYRNKEKEVSFGTTTLEILKNSQNSFFSEEENEIIYWDSHRITLLWLDLEEKLPQWRNNKIIYNSFASLDKIKNVSSYPDKPDYLIIELNNGVWALEKEGPQNNIAPLYKGKNPKIISIEKDFLIIFDDNNYLKITLP